MRCRGLKVETANYGLKKGQLTKDSAELYCYAISAKRYALFNVDRRGRPVMRKLSAHGLGHLLPPYGDDQSVPGIPSPVVDKRALGVDRWQHDLWYRIVKNALRGDRGDVQLSDLPGFDGPAASRYAATAPTLLAWFGIFNRGRPYRQRVRPMGFLLAYHGRSIYGEEEVQPIAPYDRDTSTAAGRCFDRVSTQPVPRERLRSYAELLQSYQRHPEAKFLGGDYAEAGMTERRHVLGDGAEYIGKEADRWEEQYFLGLDPDAQIEYGMAPDDVEQLHRGTLAACRAVGVRRVAAATGVNHARVSRLTRNHERLTPEMHQRLRTAVVQLRDGLAEDALWKQQLLQRVRAECIGMTVRKFAALAGVSRTALSQVLSGRRKPSSLLFAQIEAALDVE